MKNLPLTETRLCSRVLPWILGGVGIIVIGIAVGTEFLSPNSSHGWGPNRILVLEFGLRCLGLALAAWLVNKVVSRLVRRRDDGANPTQTKKSAAVAHASDQASRQPTSTGATGSLQRFRRSGWQTTLLVPLFVIMVLAYAWYATFGRMSVWPSSGDYYALLAEAFLKGQPALLVEPRAELALLDDVYEAAGTAIGIRKIRHGLDEELDKLLVGGGDAIRVGEPIPLMHDASYFDGKYYLYFGPAPATLAALVKVAFGWRLTDRTLVFLAVGGILAVNLLTLDYVRKTHLPLTPTWLTLGGGVLVAVAHPLLFILSRAALWEAAVAWGQLFLLLGIMFALRILDGTDLRPWRLAVTGSMWVLAVGSRIVLASAVGGLVLVVWLSIRRAQRQTVDWRRSAVSFSYLVFPLVIGAVMLSFYNFVRFKNPLETGFRYQLTGTNVVDALEDGVVFNSSYLAPNLAYYLVAKPTTRLTFPFVRPLRDSWDRMEALLGRGNLPEIYEVETVTGVLVAAPLSPFAAILLMSILCRPAPSDVSSNLAELEGRSVRQQAKFKSIVVALAVASFCAFLPLLSFFTVADRYILDFSPSLALLTVLGVWYFHDLAQGRPHLTRALNALFILGLVSGVAVTMLLAITGSDSLFDDMNPALFQYLVRTLSW